MLVLLSSTRAAKVEGARAALVAIGAVDNRFAGAEVRLLDLTHIAPRMPLDEAAIVDGARRRAQALIESAPTRTGPIYAVGLEGGLAPIEVNGRQAWMLHSWAAVTDGALWGYGAGGAVEVPPPLVARVLAGEELGDVINGLAGADTRSTRGAWGVLTRDLAGRRDAFRLAVVAAFAPFYNRDLWMSSGPRIPDGSR